MRRGKLLKTAGMILAAAMMLTACGSSQTGSSEQTTKATDTASTIEKNLAGLQGAESIALTQSDNYTDEYKTEVESSIYTYKTTDTQDSISYIFISDIHLGKPDDNYSTEEVDAAVYRELYALVDVANNTDIDFVCVGGDIQDGTSGDPDSKQIALNYLNKVSEIIENCNKPVLILKGNHDDNSFSAQAQPDWLYDPAYIINNQEWYDATMSHFSQYATDYNNGYYYYDVPGKDIRVVCLNMSDSDDTVVDGKRNEIGMYFYGYKDAQIDWLLNSAMSRQDCQYVFLSHDAFDYPQGYGTDSNRDTLESILNAATTHTAFSTDKFSKDFSDWTGEVQLYHCGHLHQERSILSDEIGGIPLINTDIGRAVNYFSVPQEWRDMQYEHLDGRELNTISEALFDIVISKSDQVNFIRFGNGDDWTLNK